MVMSDWRPGSWQEKPATQQPVYPDQTAVARVIEELSRLPPLVTSWEIEGLKKLLGRAARGEHFLLQGGDCAESFDECDSSALAAKLKILLQMSLVLIYGGRKGVVRVGRLAGQYAKPRSTDHETRDGVTLPSYRGDLVNRSGFTPAERTPDPMLLLRGYERAALTLNFTRALAEGGFADLHHPEYWDLSFVKDRTLADDYQRIVNSLRESLEFMEAVSGQRFSEFRRVDFYTSHEGLSLIYEQAQTRTVPRRTGWYNLSTHMPWIGMRTAQLEGAHVEYFRGILNPMGIKVGPAMTPEWLLELLSVLDPNDEPGRIVVIHRMGAGGVEAKLPPLIEAVKRAGRTVLWCSDPMHGNTETAANGYKTRRFDNILSELEQAFDVHARMGSILGGVHFEMTGDNVTECIGGASGVVEADLQRAYRTRVDPRLNYEQALEMAMRIARRLRAR
ncbi:MAG TPA: 3-deoxy-7-phosphoheptulonate synthase class II [Kofleriaceae bacterium]|nr:3-deoxy-7-phosphoheptulonate synthase class II [Kofleriaceae bacterium]